MMSTSHGHAVTPSWRTARLAVPLLVAGAVLVGCAPATKPLYQWEDYQPQVYAYFNGDAKQAQIDELEHGLQKIASKGNQPPPGYHAQLGLLYADAGRSDQMIEEFQAEKALFPESAPYMDFLIKNASRQGGKK